MKPILRCILVLLVFLLCAVGVSAADPVIASMDVQAVVDRYGNSDMTVTVELSDVSGELWIPVGSDVRSVKVSSDFSKKTVDGSVWVVLEEGAGARTLVLTYRQMRCVSRNDDKTQQLSLPLVCALWPWDTQSLTFSVTLPAEFDETPTYLSGYFADAMVVEEEISGNTITCTVPGGLLNRESVTLEMALPKGYFLLFNLPGATGTVDLVLISFLSALCLFYWLFTLRSPFPRRQARQLPPDGVAAWEFPYVEHGGPPDFSLLLTEWASLGYLTVYVSAGRRVSLRRRIPMESERRPYEAEAFEALFRREDVCAADTPHCRKIGAVAGKKCRRYWRRRLFSPRSGNPRVVTWCAALVFGLVWFRAADYLLPAWTLRLLLLIPVLLLGVAAGHLLQQAVQDAIRKTPGRSVLGPLLVLLATGLLSRFGGGFPVSLLGLLVVGLAAVGTCRGGRRSESGMERVSQIQGFRRYLKGAGTHHLQLMLHEDNQYFYRLLPYAEALGVGRAFARRFANLPLEPCVFLEDERYRGRTAMEFYRYYHRMLRKMRGISGRSFL